MAIPRKPATARHREMVLRAAVPTDARGIVALVRALAVHVGESSAAIVSAEAMAAAGSGANPLWRGVVAESAGEIVGICLYSLQFSTWIGTAGLYVIDLYIAPEFRRGQLGRKLLAAAARQGKELGCRFIRLEVDRRNPGAEGFYERLGFQKRAGDTIFLLKADEFDALAAG